MNPLEGRMVLVAVQLIQAGRRTLAEVPESLRKKVEKHLSEQGSEIIVS
ncbi:CD1375 family protein [Paenibacillus donghaensis]|nr:CD1375 family protein [Paenibacillus donghaensis]